MIRDRLPKGFNAWVAATVGADLGSGVLAFALTWVATGYGPGTASMVLTLTVAPTVILGLLGGAVADRYGPRRVMITCTIALMLVSAALAFVVSARGPTEVTLLAAAILIGSIAAFHRPAIGVFPRLFVTGNALGAAMARVGTASQLAGTIAPPLGGLLIGAVALNGVAWVDVVGCLIMVATLMMVHPPLRPTVAADATTFRGIRDGIAVAARTRGVTALLLCVGIVAGAVLPAVILGVPLAARERGWTAAEAGVIEAGWIAGGLGAGAWFSWRGTAATMATDGHRPLGRRHRSYRTIGLAGVASSRREHLRTRRRRHDLHRARVPHLRLARARNDAVALPEPADHGATSTPARHRPAHRHRRGWRWGRNDDRTCRWCGGSRIHRRDVRQDVAYVHCRRAPDGGERLEHLGMLTRLSVKPAGRLCPGNHRDLILQSLRASLNG